MAMVIRCATCDTEYEADAAAITAGTRRRQCPVCHPPDRGDPAPATCAECGRPLRSLRARCARCLGVAA
jgi:DNA-directed RNA polymerase subunit RPC12/RpoP